jgi:hypothetical protein
MQAAAEASAQAAGVKAFEILGSLPRLHTLGLASMTVSVSQCIANRCPAGVAHCGSAREM